MQISQIQLTNFRNYSSSCVKLDVGKNILIGENAQGKTNFLEAIEVAATGHSFRTNKDNELMNFGQEYLHLQIDYKKQEMDETISIVFKALPSQTGITKLEKQIKINGVIQNSSKSLLGKLVVVSFKSHDLNLLRAGPKFRREWLDDVMSRIKPIYQDILSSYNKVLLQRNRFLKYISEKGRVTISDQDALLAWDKQLVRFGCQIIWHRIKLLEELLPLARTHQSQISGGREALDVEYVFNTVEPTENKLPSDSDDNIEEFSLPLSKLKDASKEDIATLLLKLLKRYRSQEIWRRQTLLGPHRDDVLFTLNQSNAITFASQGQQRSLVLAVKLAELDRITEELDESPILLLDDVLAELDVLRQGFLMSAVSNCAQTIITTTHLNGFDNKWLEGASIYLVNQGVIMPEPIALAP